MTALNKESVVGGGAVLNPAVVTLGRLTQGYDVQQTLHEPNTNTDVQGDGGDLQGVYFLEARNEFLAAFIGGAVEDGARVLCHSGVPGAHRPRTQGCP